MLDQHAAPARALALLGLVRLELAEVIGQDLAIGGVQLEQAQAVLLARHLLGHVGRAGVVAHLAARIHALDEVKVLLQRGRNVGAVPQRADTGFEFGCLV